MAARSQRTAQAGPAEGPWALPDGWRWERLGDVAPLNPRRALDHLADDDEVVFVPMAAVEAETGRIDVTGKRRFHSVRQGFTRFAPADVLFAKITPCMENGKIAVVPSIEHGVGFGSTEFHVLAGIGALPRYLYYWVSQLSVRQDAEFNMTGTAGQKRVPVDFLRNALLPVPPIDTQQAVVNRIDELLAELDDGEEALARARADLGTWRKALLKAAVTGELTADWRAAHPTAETGADLLVRMLAERRARWQAHPRNRTKNYSGPGSPGMDALPDLPPNWVWATMSQLGAVSGGVTKNAKRESHPVRLPYLRVGNVYEGRFDLSRIETIGLEATEIERVTLADGDLLIVEGNGSIEHIGRSAVWGGQIASCVHQNHLIKFRPSLRILSDLLQLWLTSLSGRVELERLASSTSGLHTLSISKIEAIRCPLPPLEEIGAIVSALGDAMGSCIEAESAQNDVAYCSATLRQSILAAAFRGELAQ